MVPPERPPAGEAPLGADLVVPGLAAAFAIYFFVSIADLAWEAKANGVLIGTILVALIVIQLGRIGMRVARGNANFRFDPLWAPRDALPQRIGLVLLTVVFIGTIRWLGLTLGLFLALAAALRLMGVRKRSHLVLVPLAVAAAAYGLFIAALDSDLPRGPVEHLLALLFRAGA